MNHVMRSSNVISRWLLVCFSSFPVIFAPTELKVRAKMNSLHVTWQPPPNHTQISGYKLFCREMVGEELTNGEAHPERERVRRMEAHTIKLRKRVKHHEVSSLGESGMFTCQCCLNPFLLLQVIIFVW